MPETIAIINQKGGVGKSTTVLALAAGLCAKRFHVLCVDLDAQGNLSYALDAQGRRGAQAGGPGAARKENLSEDSQEARADAASGDPLPARKAGPPGSPPEIRNAPLAAPDASVSSQAAGNPDASQASRRALAAPGAPSQAAYPPGASQAARRAGVASGASDPSQAAYNSEKPQEAEAAGAASGASDPSQAAYPAGAPSPAAPLRNTPTAWQVLLLEAPAADAILPGGPGTPDLIAASPLLSGADAVLTGVGKEYRLREALEGVLRRYDFILIDTPPSLGILTVAALTAADTVIIPAQADIFSLQGIGQLAGTIDTVRRYCNRGLAVEGILLTRFSPRAVLSRDIADMTRQTAESIGTRLFTATIREGVAVREAQASRQSLFDYAPRSNAAADYHAFVDEFCQRRNP